MSALMSRNPIAEAATDPDEVVRFDDVSMRYGRGPEVLRDLTFSLAPGTFHFITGPSGAGKSSLLKLIYLAARPSKGLIRLFGERAERILHKYIEWIGWVALVALALLLVWWFWLR